MPSTLIKQFEGFKPEGFPFGSYSFMIPRQFSDPGDVSETLLPSGTMLLDGKLVFPAGNRKHAWTKVFSWPVIELMFPDYLSVNIYGFGFDAFETDETTKFCSLARYSTKTASGTVTYKVQGGVCNGVTYRSVINDGWIKEWSWEFDEENMTMGPVLEESGVIVITDRSITGGSTCSIGAPRETRTTSEIHVGTINYSPTTKTSTSTVPGANGTMEYELSGAVTLTTLKGLVAEWKGLPEAYRLATNNGGPPISTETSDGQYASASGGFARYRADDVDIPDGYELLMDCVVRRNVSPYRDFNRGIATVTYEDLVEEYVEVRTGQEFATLTHNVVDEAPMRIGLIGGMTATENVSVIGAAVRLASRSNRRHRVKVIWSIVQEESELEEYEVTLQTDRLSNSRRVSDWEYWDAKARGRDVSFLALSIKDAEDFVVQRWDDEGGGWETVNSDEPGYRLRYGNFYTGIRSPESEIWTEVKVVRGEKRGYGNDGKIGYRKKVLAADLRLVGEPAEANACGVTLTGSCKYEVEITMNKWGNVTDISGDNEILGYSNGIPFVVDDRNPEMRHPWYREPELIYPQDHSDNEYSAYPVAVVARDTYPYIPHTGVESNRYTLSFPIRSDTEFGSRYTEWVGIPDPPAGFYVQLEYPRIRKA